jgi:glycosyltransferase involved in cell wall biosynthesis
MKITVVNLTGGGLSGGYLKYLRELLPLLWRDPEVSKLQVFWPAGTESRLGAGLPERDGFTCRDTREGRALLRQRIRQLAPDVVFFPSYRWLELGGCPTVSMIRNMEPLVRPIAGNRVSDMARNLGRAYAAWQACRHATRVIAVSNYVRDFLVRTWHVPEERLGVVYHGVAPPLAGASLPTPDSLAGVGREPFLFTAGSIRPARGLEDLVDALGALSSAQGLRLPLVVAGELNAAARPYYRKIMARARRRGVAGQIHWAGQLGFEEMSWCYAHCQALVMTSRVEACPNVALEAMSYGCLSIAAANPPLPEFFQDAAYYYRPGDGYSLATVLMEAVQLAAVGREELRHLAQERAKRFTWEKTAAGTLREIKLALGQIK